MTQQETNLDDAYQKLASASSILLTWRWDDRFEGILAEFETENQDAVLAAVRATLSAEWNAMTIADAPRVIDDALHRFGGLQAGQLLFTSDANQPSILLGLWWPWGNGTKISLRLVPHGLQNDDQGKETLRSAFYV